MSGPLATSRATLPRVELVEAESARDVFEVVSIDDQVICVRSPFLFELGEELHIRIADASGTRDVTVRVRAHTGDPKLTELELVS
ncbi:MAG TPA: hypothetical protein VGG28_18910 [Kofleriaceae bacterium]|jgi:hypothetical protein